MLLNDFSAHPKPKSCARRFFGSKERIEDARQRGGVNAFAVIGYGDPDPMLTAVDARRSGDAQLDGASFPNRFKTVGQKVGENLA